jgi:transposase-like protein
VDTSEEADTVSTMDEEKKQKRARRTFTDEFKAEAVRLVLDEGKSVGAVAKDLDLSGTIEYRLDVDNLRGTNLRE